MLTQQEQAGIKSILALLGDADVQSLATTLTKGHIAVYNKEECEQAILAFSKSGKDFLHRRACSKAILVQYVYQEGLPVNSKLSRDEVIRRILQHWSSQFSSVEPRDQRISGESSSPQNKVNGKLTVINNYLVNVNISHHQENKIDVDRQFSQQFTHWFYDNLNHHDPVSQGFVPSSFMPGVALRTRLISPGSLNEQVIEGCDNVANYFLELFRRYKLQPNYSDQGVQTKSDPHGLRIVLVCGTLYKDSVLRGVFEQSFGLVQDPHHAQNWKIQVSELRLNETFMKERPQLQDFCDISEIEGNTIRLLEVALRK